MEGFPKIETDDPLIFSTRQFRVGDDYTLPPAPAMDYTISSELLRLIHNILHDDL